MSTEEKTGKEKFDELMLEMSKPIASGFNKDLSKVLMNSLGTSKVTASKPSGYHNMQSIVSANAAALIVMPAAKPEDWLVQVYPDVDGYVHFQAKSSTHTPAGAYTRWYVKVTSISTWNAVNAAYSLEGAEKRNSFFAVSNKLYLVCKRVNETKVDIPGYGEFEVPQLFGLNLSSSTEDTSVIDAEIVEAAAVEGNDDENDLLIEEEEETSF